MRFIFKQINLCVGFLVASTIFVLFSCNPNKCNFVNCANGGVCNNGGCTCVTGYEGPLCETISTTNFTGTHNVWDSGTLYGPVNYSLSIYPELVIIYMNIDSLYNYQFPCAPNSIDAYISGADTFIIPPQMVMGKLVVGQGCFYNTGKVVVNYQVTDNASGVVDYRLMTWTN